MKLTQLHSADGLRTFAVVFDTGDEVADLLLGFAREQQLTAAEITGIGAFQRVVLGYFDWEAKDYRDIPIEDQVEVVSFLGNVACTSEGQPKVHAHLVVAKRDGSALGGHLRQGVVRPTLELVVTETPAHLRRRHDEATGLALIDATAS